MTATAGLGLAVLVAAPAGAALAGHDTEPAAASSRRGPQASEPREDDAPYYRIKADTSGTRSVWSVPPSRS